MAYFIVYITVYQLSNTTEAKRSVRALLTFGGLFDIADKKNIHQ